MGAAERLTPPSSSFDMGASGAAALIGEALLLGEREEALDEAAVVEIEGAAVVVEIEGAAVVVEIEGAAVGAARLDSLPAARGWIKASLKLLPPMSATSL